jgi:hypothetical protein
VARGTTTRGLVCSFAATIDHDALGTLRHRLLRLQLGEAALHQALDKRSATLGTLIGAEVGPVGESHTFHFRVAHLPIG